jgi:hypothetical protein
VTFQHNIVKNSDHGLNILAYDDSGASQQTSRILIAQNYWDQVGGRLFQILNSPAGGTDDVTIQHNTSNLAGSQFLNLGDTLNRPNTDLVVRDNLAPAGTYGVFGGGVGSGTVALNAYAQQWAFERNVLAGANAAAYPANNFYPASFLQGIGFVDPANGDYRLLSTSPYKNRATDGSDPGVDFETLWAKTARALSGIPEPLLGDFDGDDDVDGRDFLAWQRDPSIGALADWQANYGSGSIVVASVDVPEPPTWMLLSLAAMVSEFATAASLLVRFRNSRMRDTGR